MPSKNCWELTSSFEVRKVATFQTSIGKWINGAVQMIVALISNFIRNSAALNMHEELFE